MIAKEYYKNLPKEVVLLFPIDSFRYEVLSSLNGSLKKHLELIGKAIYAINKDITIDTLRNFLDGFNDYLVKNITNKFGATVQLNEADLTALLINYVFEQGDYELARALILIRYYSHARGKKKSFPPNVKRRNGQIVPFMRYKIENALTLSGVSWTESIVAAIVERAQAHAEDTLTLDTLQDFIVGILVEQDEIYAAKLYAKYRAGNITKRLEEIYTYKNTPNKLVVKEADGSEYYFTIKELQKIVKFCSSDIEKLFFSEDEIIARLLKSVYDGITREDLNKTLLLNAKSLMEYDYRFGYFAARILLLDLYEKTLGFSIGRHRIEKLDNLYQEQFSNYIRKGIEEEMLDPRLLEFDLERLSKLMSYKNDFKFSYLGVQTLYDRYFIRDRKNNIIEAMQYFWARVAMGLSILEGDKKNDIAEKAFELYVNRKLCPSTPTLFNSGTLRPQLSSCYLYVVDDSIESIMQRGISDAAYLTKWAGGIGGSWTKVRGIGAKIKGTNGESQGVVPFLRIHNATLFAVNQGGKRSGSGCAYLEVWHNDIEAFCQLRRNTGDERVRTHDMNTAVWIPDLFMERVIQKSYWTLFRSSDVPELHDLYGEKFRQKYLEYEKLYEEGKIWGERIEALELWKTILKMLYETGHPWITFKDPCNIRSPQDHAGVIHSSNLCTEITLNTSEDEIAVCNLASIVLESFIDENGNLMEDELKETIRLSIRLLDNVIDINFYPVEAARNSNTRHRPIGLGVMGMHYALYKANILFESEEAVRWNDMIMEKIAYYAYEASCELAAERKPYPSYEGSKWDRGILPHETIDLLENERKSPVLVNREIRMDWNALKQKIKKYGMRNSNVLAIAPTATISNIMGSSPSIEPLYSNYYVKSNLSGDFIVINKFMQEDLEKIGLWNKDMINLIKYYDGDLLQIDEISENIKNKYKTCFQISYKTIIDMAAVRGKWIDQSQSLNLYYSGNSLKELSQMYKYAWSCGVKTTYYLRSTGASRVQKNTVIDIEVESMNKKREYNIDNNQELNMYKACSISNKDNYGECEVCQ